jgi:hypothetical protein
MCIELTTTRKGSQSVVEYYTKMSSYTDELATYGHPLGDEEFVSHLLAGLKDFDPMVSAVVAHVEPITPAELYSHMLSHELRRDHQSEGNTDSYSSANTAVSSHGGPGHFSGRGRGRGGSHLPHFNNSKTSMPRSTSPSGGRPW